MKLYNVARGSGKTTKCIELVNSSTNIILVVHDLD